MRVTSTDRIEKTLVLKASRSRVWRAVSDAREFGDWFGVKLHGQFRPHTPITADVVEPPGFEDYHWEITVDRIEPETYFSFHWHPFAVEKEYDYASEPPTLVEFTLEDVEGGTRLTISESGFDAIPAHRRDEAFRMNDGGWTAQVESIKEHVRRNP